MVNIHLDKCGNLQPIRDNPFRVVCKKGADPEKSYAEGPGLTEASDNRPAHFTIFAINEDDQPVTGEWTEVTIKDANGDNAGFPLTIKDNEDGTYAVEFQADKPGEYELCVLLGDQPVRDMPSKLVVHKGCDASNTYVTGPGVEEGVVDRDLPFTIHAKDKDGEPLTKGGDNFIVDIQGPNGAVPCNVTDNGDGTYSGVYHPTEAGDYTVDLRVNDQAEPVGKSPYHCTVKHGGDPTQSYAKGEGWHYAYDNKKATFKVYVRDEHNKPVIGEKLTVVFLDKTSQEYKDKVAEMVSQVDEYMLKKKADMSEAYRTERKEV